MSLVVRVDIREGELRCTDFYKQWDIKMEISTCFGDLVEPTLELVADYQPGRSLDIWHLRRKRQHKLFAVSSPSPTTVNLSRSNFLATAKYWELLQFPIVQYIRFAVWSCFERGCTPNTFVQKEHLRCIQMYEQFTEYSCRGMKIETILKKSKKNQRIVIGEKIQFSLQRTESLVLASLLKQSGSEASDHETLLIQKLNRRQWGIQNEER